MPYIGTKLWACAYPAIFFSPSSISVLAGQRKRNSHAANIGQESRDTPNYSCTTCLALFCLSLEQLGRKKEEAKSFLLFILSHFPSAAEERKKQPTTISIFWKKFLLGRWHKARHFCRISFPRNMGEFYLPQPLAQRDHSRLQTDLSLRFQLRLLQIAN